MFSKLKRLALKFVLLFIAYEAYRVLIYNCTPVFKELCNHYLKALIAIDFALILGLSINKIFNRLLDMRNNQYYLMRKKRKKDDSSKTCGRWKYWIAISFWMQNVLCSPLPPLFIHSNSLLFISFPLSKTHYNLCLSSEPRGELWQSLNEALRKRGMLACHVIDSDWPLSGLQRTRSWLRKCRYFFLFLLHLHKYPHAQVQWTFWDMPLWVWYLLGCKG